MTSFMIVTKYIHMHEGRLFLHVQVIQDWTVHLQKVWNVCGFTVSKTWAATEEGGHSHVDSDN